jgi:fumarylpyruvate hydrolase
MIDLSIPVVAPTTLPVVGTDARFHVNRVFCIGRNYAWSPTEAEVLREMPPWFMKPADAVVLAEGVVPYPSETRDFCHEIELVVAIGQGGCRIQSEAVVSQHIWGYAVGLDLTRRDLQQQAKHTGGPWEAAKAFDRSAPCTPVVRVSDCGHPTRGAIWLSVNGVDRQRADLSELLWSVPELVSMLSQSVTLKAGDLIFTGTPAGVGPLQPGDVVRGGVADIGQFLLSVGSP